MGEAGSRNGRAAMAPAASGTPREHRPSSRPGLRPAVVVVGILGTVILALLIAAFPLAAFAHQSVDASGGSLPVWVSAGFGVVGFVVALRKPGNLLAWALLALAFCGALSQDASFYAVADYRRHHGALAFGWLALLAQPFWAPGLVLLGLVFLLFPDGRPPSPRWRWVLWLALVIGGVWIASAFVLTIQALADHHLQVDASGNLLVLGNTAKNAAWWNAVTTVAGLVLLACWIACLSSQAFSYRRSSGERRQQLKWLLAGSLAGGAAIAVSFAAPGGLVSAVCLVAFMSLPFSIGVAVLKYRLFDIDRVLSRTLAYAIVTGLLVGLYAGLVVLTTQVLRFHSAVGVVASTVAAAGLFHPLRRRVQRLVDRRFNRSRFDADRMVADFATRLKEAANLESVRDDLTGVVLEALEPAQVQVWIARKAVARPTAEI